METINKSAFLAGTTYRGTNHARDVRIVSTGAPRAANPFSWAEIDNIVAVIRPTRPDIADAILVSAHTGLRAGELRALRVGDYRLLPFPHLVVRASHSEGSVEGSPKSGKTRQIPVDGYVKPVLDFRARGRGMGE